MFILAARGVNRDRRNCDFHFALNVWSRIAPPLSSSIHPSVNWAFYTSRNLVWECVKMEDIDIDDAPDHGWISGDMLGIIHRRLIDVGGAGEVHEVQ